MKFFLHLILFLLPFQFFAQDNMVYKNKKAHIKMGKYTYTIDYEHIYNRESRVNSYYEVIIKNNKKQYIGEFIYQLKGNTEIRVSPQNPTPVQIENRILKSYSLDYDEKSEQIIVTSYYHDKENVKEKEIKILQQNKNGFFYTKEKKSFYRDGQEKIEKYLSEK